MLKLHNVTIADYVLTYVDVHLPSVAAVVILALFCHPIHSVLCSRMGLSGSTDLMNGAISSWTKFHRNVLENSARSLRIVCSVGRY